MFQARAVAHFKPNTQNLNQIRELLSVAWNLTSNMGGGAERLKTGMWKRKRQIFVETEAVKGYRFRFGLSYQTLKSCMWCSFL